MMKIINEHIESTEIKDTKCRKLVTLKKIDTIGSNLLDSSNQNRFDDKEQRDSLLWDWN